jgi:iron complex outermembrane receptor protein
VVGPEELLSYEIGYKGSLLDNRLNVSASVYYYDYDDLQVIKQDVVNGIRLNTFVNADQASAMGLELEFQTLPVDELLFSGTYSYNDTEYKDFATKDANRCSIGPLSQGHSLDPLCQDEQNLDGNQFPLTPEHKASLNATYFFDAFTFDWAATLSYMYTGKQWMEPFNVSELDRVGSYSRWDANLAATTSDGVWKAVVFVRNISNDREILTQGRPDPVTHNAQAVLSEPRIYGMSLEYNF